MARVKDQEQFLSRALGQFHTPHCSSWKTHVVVHPPATCLSEAPVKQALVGGGLFRVLFLVCWFSFLSGELENVVRSPHFMKRKTALESQLTATEV